MIYDENQNASALVRVSRTGIFLSPHSLPKGTLRKKNNMFGVQSHVL